MTALKSAAAAFCLATAAFIIPAVPAPAAEGTGTVEMIIDDKTPGGVDFEPAEAWKPCPNTQASYEGSSVVTVSGSEVHRATFLADIPVEGEYELWGCWVAAGPESRSSKVICMVYPSTGSYKATINQVSQGADGDSAKFVNLGRYYFKQQKSRPIISFTTEGLPENVEVSVDAIKLVLVKPGSVGSQASAGK